MIIHSFILYTYKLLLNFVTLILQYGHNEIISLRYVKWYDLCEINQNKGCNSDSILIILYIVFHVDE